MREGSIMLRRNTRLRKYLYRNSLEGKERLIYEKKRKIREALQGSPLSLCLQLKFCFFLLNLLQRENRFPLSFGMKRRCFVEKSISKMRTLLVTSEIIETCRAHDFTDVVLVHENCGVPDGLFIIHLPFGPTAFFELLNVVTRHDIKDKKAMGTMPQLGERIANILKHLFPVPKPDTKRIITFSNRSDYISFRHHTYGKHGGPKSIELEEIGPRFDSR